MKPKKSKLKTKNKVAQATPIKMESALTNLDRLVEAKVQLPPETAAVPIAEHETESARPIQSSRTIESATTIAARIDVGFGNALFIRGKGPGLTWDKGLPLQCEEPSRWSWRVENGNEPIEFKLLLNDQLWAHGENLQVRPGQRIEIVPCF